MGTIPMESRISRGKNGKLYPRFCLGYPLFGGRFDFIHKEKKNQKKKEDGLAHSRASAPMDKSYRPA